MIFHFETSLVCGGRSCLTRVTGLMSRTASGAKANVLQAAEAAGWKRMRERRGSQVRKLILCPACAKRHRQKPALMQEHP